MVSFASRFPREEGPVCLHPIFEDTLRRIRPSVVHLAGHGSFDAIEGVNWIETTWPEPASLEMVLDILGDVIPELLVLGICESARLPLDIGLRSAGPKLPSHLAHSVMCAPCVLPTRTASSTSFTIKRGAVRILSLRPKNRRGTDRLCSQMDLN